MMSYLNVAAIVDQTYVEGPGAKNSNLGAGLSQEMSGML